MYSAVYNSVFMASSLRNAQWCGVDDNKGVSTAKRASDVMTRSRLKQTGMEDDIEDFFKGKSRCS